MIQFFHVNKYFQNIPALEAVNLRIEKGEFIFLTGPSGAGKSTLLRLLFCADSPTSGQILIDGRNIARITRKSIPYLRRNIGVVFQDFKLLHSLNVFDNVAFTLQVLGAGSSEIKRKTFSVLQAVGLQHKINLYPRVLSGGEQQRVAIARAIVNEPAILLADEPTGNLDMDLTYEIMSLFMRINARGTTVIIATHNTELIKNYNKRVVFLEKGRIIDK
ncbi:MAG TPA: cell division ATP-binding protein FtsE [bacterium]